MNLVEALIIVNNPLLNLNQILELVENAQQNKKLEVLIHQGRYIYIVHNLSSKE